MNSIRTAVAALLATAVAIIGLAALAAPRSLSADAGDERLLISFDSDGVVGTTLNAGAPISDASGWANNGVVAAADGGTIAIVADSGRVVADFPADCAAPPPCQNAMVQIADAPSLNPMMADFEWGARILMQANETDDGENIVQKGVTDEPGGQWKLQVDKAGGLPSCVVSGRVPGEAVDRRVLLKSTVGVADGVWHQVTCRRSAAGVEVLVDGVVTGAVAMPVVFLDSDADVTIGAKWVVPSENDQFHGMLDDVFMSAHPNAIETVVDGAGANRPAVRLMNAAG